MQPPGALGHVHPPATWQRKSRWVTGEADEALRVGVVSFHSANAGGGGGVPAAPCRPRALSLSPAHVGICGHSGRAGTALLVSVQRPHG